MNRRVSSLAQELCLTIAIMSAGFPLPTVAAEGRLSELAGIWEAKRRFGPELRGEASLHRSQSRWIAQVGGYTVEFSGTNELVEFDLPGDRGRFTGRLDPATRRIDGHWQQPPLVTNGLAFASPVTFEPVGPDRWHGRIVPLDDDFTFYLVARPRHDGSMGAFLRNPERNQGVFFNVDHVDRSGDRVELVGTFFRNTDEQVLLEGTIFPAEPRITIDVANRGGAYDFRPLGDDTASPFYARGRNPEPYVYQPPPEIGDGWDVGTLDEVAIDVEPLRRLIESEIDLPADDVHDLYIHAMLIARRGKLVLEEYFHGHHRYMPHDTRSASKSLTATLVGAANYAGHPIGPSTPVYSTIYGNAVSPDLDPRKSRMQVEHLLTMSSGYDCDDGDYSTPGNEERMQEQTDNLDWYDYTLELPMIREPGTSVVYCSINPNLIGKVLIAATGRPLPLLFHQLIAEPLAIDRYHLALQPTGEPYMGGGIHWLPRDFMKLGQLHITGGTWNGRRILSRDWVERATSALNELRERHYGYLWWVEEYPYRGRKVRAFYAGGNGGQVVMGIPELDLVVAFFGGNYSSKTLYRAQREFVPRFILPAVEE